MKRYADARHEDILMGAPEGFYLNPNRTQAVAARSQIWAACSARTTSMVTSASSEIHAT